MGFYKQIKYLIGNSSLVTAFSAFAATGQLSLEMAISNMKNSNTQVLIKNALVLLAITVPVHLHPSIVYFYRE
jgi:hypothetical protein